MTRGIKARLGSHGRCVYLEFAENSEKQRAQICKENVKDTNV